MRRWIIAGGVTMLTAYSIGRADSIWDRRDPRYANLFQDNRARNVGDLLTVIITETTVATDQDARAVKRNTNSSGQMQFFGTAPVTSGGTAAIPGIAVGIPGQTTSRTFDGSSQLSTNQVFTDKMALTVVDIMPNGNLVVEGYRSRVVAGEERVLRVTGIVRQADIGVGNIVLSQTIANFRISYLGRGPATRATAGVVGRVSNWFGPR